MHHMSDDMRACIDQCLACYSTCLGTAMTHCLDAGGKHTETAHFRLHFMLLTTPHHKHTCRECAEICEECAQDCERLGDMDECVKVCRSCAESCRRMAA
jgi:hypothetical protein